MPDSLPDVDQQSWQDFSADRWFKQSTDRINSIGAPAPGTAFLQSSSNRIAGLGGLTMPAPIPAPPMPQFPAPQLPTLPTLPTPAPATAPPIPTEITPPAPPPMPAPVAPPTLPPPVSLPTPPPPQPIPPLTGPSRPIQDVSDVPTVGGTQVQRPSGSIYAPTAPDEAAQSPFGGAANGPFASNATSSIQSAGPAGAIPASINIPVNQGPTISRQQAIAALQGTPLQDIAGQIWDLGVKYNVDPAFALSIAKNESAYGDPTIAPGQARNNNIWDISNAAYGGQAVPGSRWGQYPDKLTAAEAFYKLITSEYYPKGQTTVGSVMWGPNGSQQHAYAPTSENSTDYPDRLINTMKGYGSMAGAAAPPPPTAPQSTAMSTSQFGDRQLSTDEAYAACGPAAAVRFAQAYGRNPTLREAVDLAKQVGWTSGQGMAGIGSEQKLLEKMGISTRMVGPDLQAIAHEAQTGNPVTISTPGHYFYADGYNPQTGAFHVGQSGLDLKNGKEWMTPTEMSSLMGQIQGALFADNPTAPAASTAAPIATQLDQTRQTLAKALNPNKSTIPTQAMTQFAPSSDPQVQMLDNAVQTVAQPQQVSRSEDQNPWGELGNTIVGAIQRAVSGITGGLGPPGGPPGGPPDDQRRRDQEQQNQDLSSPQTGEIDLRQMTPDMIDRLFANPVTREPNAIEQATGLYTSPPKDLQEAADRALRDIQRRGVPFPGPGGSISFLQPGRSLRELNPLSKGPDAGVLEDILSAVPGLLGGVHAAEEANPLKSVAADAAGGVSSAMAPLVDKGVSSLEGGLKRNLGQQAWDAIVRELFDSNTDLGNIEKELSRRLGRPLDDSERLAALARFDPSHQAESVLEHALAPALTDMSPAEQDAFYRYIGLETDRSSAEGLAKIAEREALQGGIADSTNRRLAEAQKELEAAQQEHGQALADQRAIDAGSGYRTKQSIGLDAAGRRVSDAQDALDEAVQNAQSAAAARKHEEVMAKGELVRPRELQALAVAESDARRANAAYERLAARDSSVPIAPQGANNAARAAYERRVQVMSRQVAYTEDRVSRLREALGLNTAERGAAVEARAGAAADRAGMSLTQEAKDLLKKVDEGGVPTRMTDSLKRIASDHGIPVTSDTTPNDVIDALRKIRRNPPATPELAAAQVRLRYEQANLDRLQKAKSEGQRILDETLARAWRKRDLAQRDVDQATADLPAYAKAQGFAQLTGRTYRGPNGEEWHYDDIMNALRDFEDQHKDTPAWDKFQRGKQALQDLRVRQLNERVDAGLLTPEARDGLLDTYDFHTPKHMVDYMTDERPGVGMPRGSTFTVRNSGIRSYTPEGSTLESENPVAAVIREIYSHYNTIAQNNKTKAFINADNGALRRIADSVEQYNEAGGAAGKLLHPDYKLKADDRPVIAMVNGKRQEYVTNNPLLKEAIQHQSLGTDNKWLQALQLPAKITRETAVQRNPKFLPVNMLRDTASTVLKEMTLGGPTIGGMGPDGRWAWDFRPTRGLGSMALNLGPAALTAAMTDENDPERGKKVAAALLGGMASRAALGRSFGMGPSASRAFIHAFMDNMAGLGTGRMTGEGVRALSEAGGRVGSSDLFRGGGVQAGEEALRKLSRPNVITVRNAGDLKQLMSDALGFGWVSALGKRLENVPRQVSFEQSLARGESPLTAALRARDSSVDFNRGGRLTKVVNQYIPFTNVGFQAPAQLKRLVQENPLGALYAGMVLLGAPAAAAEHWNRSDPQRSQDYQDDPNYLTNQGIDIMLPGEQPRDANGNRVPQKIHLAVPNEFMPFVTAGRAAYNTMTGHAPAPGDLAGALGSELSPLGYGSSVSSLAQSLMPTGLSTALQLHLNQDLFRDSTIANQFSDQNASNLSKAIAPVLERTLNQIPGHDTDRIHPSQVDFVIKDILNGVGQQGLEATDTLSGRGSQTTPGTAADTPLIGGLLGRFERGTGGQRWQDVTRQDAMMSPDIRQRLRSYGDYYEPSPVSNEIEQVPLRREEQVRYQELVNQYFDEYMRRVMDRPVFGRNQQSRDALRSDAMQAAREKAGAEVFRSIRQSGGNLTARYRNKSSAY